METGWIRNRILIPLLALVLPIPAGAVVVVDNATDLRAAINGVDSQIEIKGVIELGPMTATSSNALPSPEDRSIVIRGQQGAELKATGAGYRLMDLNGFDALRMEGLTISGFSSNEPGGAIRIRDARGRFNNVTFRNNHSMLNGGALTVIGSDSQLDVTDARFDGNSANGRGGAVHLRKTVSGVNFTRVRFLDNLAGHGCAVSLRGSFGAQFYGSQFGGACDAAFVDAKFGRQRFNFVGNTFIAQGGWAFRFRVDAADEPEPNGFGGNVFVQSQNGGSELCHEIGGNAAESPLLVSRGYNVATDASCGFAQETDSLAASAEEVLADPPAPVPTAEGPATDAVALPTVGAESGDYICDIADIRGLGRPQDGNGDGMFACDLGAFERQQGPDIGASQSGAYFDPDRPGEGYFVEILEDGRASVTFFSYAEVVGSPPTPKQPSWHFGTGHVVGNSVVVSDFFDSHGTQFGDEFNPDDIQTLEFARLSLVFSGCEASPEAPGNSYLRGESFFNLPGQLVMNTRAVRLSRIVPCGQETAAPPSGLSGNFYDPDRPGEGIAVQYMPDGRVVVIWYTFSTSSQQLWLISDGATMDGDTITAPMVYPAQSTEFGQNFNPDEIELAPWGTLTLEYTDCDNLELRYDSEVDGYGSGSLEYTRLTKPAGTECPAF